MSRKQPVWHPDTMYHITSRGNRKSALFYDEIDRKAKLELLEETRFYHLFHLHAYCLMKNHSIFN
ncbi:hypothetical protein [Oceanobacillus sp. CF4.6]|uniref:hypothetical protein n=1 Tax=Oceanobacillus sp. CF4.6 TaxID=3373080 RepID=UPI003EE44D92